MATKLCRSNLSLPVPPLASEMATGAARHVVQGEPEGQAGPRYMEKARAPISLPQLSSSWRCQPC